MADPVVYRSTTPAVLTHWENTGSPAAHQAWADRVATALTDLGFDGRGFIVNETLHSAKVTAVEHPADKPIPTGWRPGPRMNGMDTIRPKRNTRPGRDAGLALDTLTQPNPRKGLPGGMPHVADVAVGCAWLGASVERTGDAVYVKWSQEISDRDRAQIDPQVWERVPLSAYYAAREAAAEQDGGDQ